MAKKGQLGQSQEKGKGERFGFLRPVLGSASRAAWNRQQLAKMVKLGGAFVSEG